MTSWATLTVKQNNGTRREYTMRGDYFEMQFREKDGGDGNCPFAVHLFIVSSPCPLSYPLLHCTLSSCSLP